MSTTFKKFVGGEVLGTSASTGYTAPTGIISVVGKASFTNTSSGEVAITVYVVPSGQSASDTYIIADAKVLQIRQTWSCPDIEGQVINAGGTIQYFCNTASAVTAIISGVEITA